MTGYCGPGDATGEGPRDVRPMPLGRLVLVVGPSGAGKDSLIRAARAALAHDPRYRFPRRVVTRAASAAEDNLEVAPDAFEALREAGAFAACWTAHGLGYGLPRAIEADLAAGLTVVCNVSRTVVPALRARHATVRVVAVTAPAPVLAARLAGRGREANGEADLRLRRSGEIPVRADVVIDNAGPLEDAARAFLAALV